MPYLFKPNGSPVGQPNGIFIARSVVVAKVKIEQLLATESGAERCRAGAVASLVASCQSRNNVHTSVKLWQANQSSPQTPSTIAFLTGLDRNRLISRGGHGEDRIVVTTMSHKVVPPKNSIFECEFVILSSA